MTDEEHDYFHKLIYEVQIAAEPKFTKGAAEHRSKGNLWDMSDEDLDKAVQEELTDLMIYNAEKLRRRHVEQAGKAGNDSAGCVGAGIGFLFSS